MHYKSTTTTTTTTTTHLVQFCGSMAASADEGAACALTSVEKPTSDTGLDAGNFWPPVAEEVVVEEELNRQVLRVNIIRIT
jgi:hypothetical protein